jgi:RES domain-containing protein
MNLRRHPRSSEFAAWLLQQLPKLRPFSEKYYRVAGPNHTTAEEIVSGIGAQKAAGRWNPPHEMPVVYLSRAPATATLEADEHFHYYKLPLWEGMPRVTVAVEAVLESVLDLTTNEVGAGLPEPMASMLAEDWRAIMARGDESTTQAIGRLAHEAGIQGILVPSKPDPSGLNLAIFRENLSKVCRLEVLNTSQLDKLGKRT